MPNPLSPRVPLEYSVGDPEGRPRVARAGRGVGPSFGARAQTIVQTEPVTVSIPVGALTAGSTTVVTATQGFGQITGVALASYDQGRVLFLNLSASQIPGAVVSHPSIQLQSAQGNPIIGELASGQSYAQLAISVSATIHAVSAVSATTLTVTGTAMLLGEALGN